MVKNIQQVIDNLLNFYDFQNKTIVSVGMGGGQFLAYSKVAEHVIAIDNDLNALNELEEKLVQNKLSEKFTLIHSDFKDVKLKGDVVLFEFCLHEMNEAQKMLEYAKNMAEDIVVVDHGTNSEWAYVADEKEKAENSWLQVLNNSVQKITTYQAEQFFEDYSELFEKVKIQGKNSIERIEKYKQSRQFIIPMEYTFALLTQ